MASVYIAFGCFIRGSDLWDTSYITDGTIEHVPHNIPDGHIDPQIQELLQWNNEEAAYGLDFRPESIVQ